MCSFLCERTFRYLQTRTQLCHEQQFNLCVVYAGTYINADLHSHTEHTAGPAFIWKQNQPTNQPKKKQTKNPPRNDCGTGSVPFPLRAHTRDSPVFACFAEERARALSLRFTNRKAGMFSDINTFFPSFEPSRLHSGALRRPAGPLWLPS